MDTHTMMQVAESTDIATQISMYKSIPSVRSFFDLDPSRWNLDDDFFVKAITEGNIDDISFLIQRVPIGESTHIKTIEESPESLVSFVMQRGSVSDISTILKSTGAKYTKYVILDAIDRKDLQILSIVAENISPNSYFKIEPVPYSIGKGEEILSLLLRYGFNMYKTSPEGSDAMYLAIESGNADMVRILLDHGFDVRDTSKSEMESPEYLWKAIDINNIDIVRMLLSAGATINAEDMGCCIDKPEILSLIMDTIPFTSDDLAEIFSLMKENDDNQSANIVYEYMDDRQDASDFTDNFEL